MAPRFIARQLSRPTGLGGWLARMGMNRGNARLNSFSFGELHPTAKDRVVEIGFGGAVLVPRLLLNAAFVCGVDRSQDVIDAASRRFSEAVRAGRAEFRVGAIENLPLPDAAFDKALSVHTVYFWQSLEAGARELARVLAPGGLVVLGFLPKASMDRMHMPFDIFSPREPDGVVAALQDAGFSDVKLRKPDSGAPWRVARGVRK